MQGGIVQNTHYRALSSLLQILPTIGHISKQYSRRQRQKDTTEQEARKWLQLMVERGFTFMWSFYRIIQQ